MLVTSGINWSGPSHWGGSSSGSTALGTFQLKPKYPLITHRGFLFPSLFNFFFFNKSIRRSLEMDVKLARDDLRIRGWRVLVQDSPDGAGIRLGKAHRAQPGQEGEKRDAGLGKELWSWEGIAASSGAGGVPADSSRSSSEIPKQEPQCSSSSSSSRAPGGSRLPCPV